MLQSLRQLRNFARRLRAGMGRLSGMQPNWRAQLVVFAYRQFLGRAPNDQEIWGYQAALAGALTPAAFLEQVATSEEAGHRARAVAIAHDPDKRLLLRQIIEAAYRLLLHRQPDEKDIAPWLAAIDAGLDPAGFIDAIGKSDEARLRSRATELGEGMSDGDFLVQSSGFLFGRGLLPFEVAALQRQLELLPGGRMRLVAERINGELARAVAADPPAAPPCVIMGTNRILTQQAWEARRREILPDRRRAAMAAIAEPQFVHSGRYKVSMIASLYRGGRYIERFLQNITSQTLFHASELIIIDANSPEGEREIIERYQKSFANIVYKRIDFRIGIYEAWNLGVGLARGEYLTNTNLDDLRRRDSIALQAGFLDANPGMDVAYQEFFYTLDADMSFEEVARLGFRSELPIVTRHSLLGCNAPHNAPMWRKSLHDSVGLFDTKYRSAGDYDFWLRCLSAGHRFGKINTPHVVYFQNPEGMSTKAETPGLPEGLAILSHYSARLVAPALRDTRQGFMARLGFGEIPEAGDARSYYDIAQATLLALARNRAVLAPAENYAGSDERRVLRILLDGLCFEQATPARAAILAAFSARPGGNDGFELFVLDRGNAPAIEGLRRIDFPSYHGAYTATDSLLIQESCEALRIDVFVSAMCTTALTTPQLQIIPEGWGVEALSDRPVRQAKETCLAVAYSSRFACLSVSAHAQLSLHYPGIVRDRVLALHGELWAALCTAWRQTANADLTAEIDPFHRDWRRIRSLQAEVDVGVD